MPKETMTPRERWLAVVNREKPDRVPMYYRATEVATKKLLKHMGCESTNEMFERLHIDRMFGVGPSYVGPPIPPGMDMYGRRYESVQYEGGTYSECVGHPLADYETIAEIERNYTWPSADWFDYSDISKQIEGVEDRVIAGGGSEPFLIYKHLRGEMQGNMDLILHPDIVHYCLEKLYGLRYENTWRIYEQIPGKVMVTSVAEDMGSQKSLLYSRKHLQEFFFPYMKRMMDLAHEAGALVNTHSDGAIREILSDLIDMGADIINPVQWRCEGMDRKALKRDFGDKLIFEGAMDNQYTLPFGTVEEVRQEVRDNIRILGDGGGYILGPCHNIQVVGPPENAVVNDVDVIVVGGGMAGVGAAITAARAGASTVLVEKFGFCGGLATGGLVNVYWVLDDGEGSNIIRGLNLEILEYLRKFYSLQETEVWREKSPRTSRIGIRNAPLFDPEALKYVAERLLIEAGVKIHYHTLVAQPIVASGRVAGVIVEAKEGRLAFGAHVVIDATGDADICYRAGAPCVETDGESVTAWFRRSDPATPERMDSYGRFLSAAPVVESHEFPLGTEHKVYLKGTTSEALTQWEIESRKIIFAKLEMIRSKRPGGKGITVVTTPVLPNVRKTRRIVGEYEIAADDNHREFPDSVFSIGNWQRAGDVFHLPYRCLIPQCIDGLLAAGRCISTASDCWDVFRIITGCVRSGEAAGAAAVCAVRSKTLPRDVDGAEVRHLMEDICPPIC